MPLGSSTRTSNLAASSIPNRRGSSVTSRPGSAADATAATAKHQRRPMSRPSHRRRPKHGLHQSFSTLPACGVGDRIASRASASARSRAAKRGWLGFGVGRRRRTLAGRRGRRRLLLVLVLLLILLVLLVLVVLLLLGPVAAPALLVLLLLQHLQRQLVIVLGLEIVRVRDHRALEPLESRLHLRLLECRRARVEGGIARAPVGRLGEKFLRGFEPPRRSPGPSRDRTTCPAPRDRDRQHRQKRPSRPRYRRRSTGRFRCAPDVSRHREPTAATRRPSATAPPRSHQAAAAPASRGPRRPAPPTARQRFQAARSPARRRQRPIAATATARNRGTTAPRPPPERPGIARSGERSGSRSPRGSEPGRWRRRPREPHPVSERLTTSPSRSSAIASRTSGCARVTTG